MYSPMAMPSGIGGGLGAVAGHEGFGPDYVLPNNGYLETCAAIGAGFAVGGYCPGTAMVGITTGRVDAMVFFIGLLVGTFAFASLFPWLEPLTTAGELTKGDRLPQLLGLPEWLVLAILVGAAIGVFYLGGWFERRARSTPHALETQSSHH